MPGDIDRRKFLLGSAALGAGVLLAGQGAQSASASTPTEDAGTGGPTSWTASAGFSGTEGANQWSYLERPSAGGPFTDLPIYGLNSAGIGVWRTAAMDGWMDFNSCHPGTATDVARAWTAPMSGIVAVTGTVRKNDTGGGNGVVAVVQLNDTILWVRTVQAADGTGYVTDTDLTAIQVTTGDVLYFIINNNGEYSYDETGWDPTVSYVTPPQSWTASTGFSGTEGANQWSYLERPSGGGAFTDLPVYGVNSAGLGVWRTASLDSWIDLDSCHPGTATDIVRAWTAPTSGVVAVTGRAHKNDTGGGNGVVAIVQLNNTVLWTRTIQATDAIGYTTDAELSSVTVSAGDVLYFIINNNGDYTYDETGWNPTVTYVTVPTWTLSTTDTTLLLTVQNNHPTVLSLANPTQNWNWLADAQQLPMLDRVNIGGTDYAPNWSYQGATVSTTGGTTVVLTFTSTTPALSMTSTWFAGPGSGPVENTVSIVNNTGSTVTYQYSDIRASELSATSDAAAVTLWRFNRSNVNSPADSGFTTGVFTTAMSSYQPLGSQVSNDCNAGNYLLPFKVFDSAGNHGLYFGYTWDFGTFTDTTAGRANLAYSRFTLGGTGQVAEAAGATFVVPGMFYGTYQGDVDDGSNTMKQWFYANKMTPTLRANSNEPLTEYGVDLYSASDITAFLAANDLSSWGVELIKEDYDWTTDATSTNPPFGDQWTPDPTKWPNGMTLGSIAHANSVKLSLYMGNTYQGADLATQAGRTAEIAALDTRFTSWNFDYWRTDNFYEATDDYLSHEGFLVVMDHMISTYPGFRWENCSSGGTKKSFDLCQRMTVMTVEDSGVSNTAVINYRMAYYANSYMINSVQLKCDNAYPFPYNDTTTSSYVFRTGFLGAWMFGCLAGQTSATPEYIAALTLYKEQQRPILRGANVYHILPMPDGTNWDGMQFFNPSLNKGSILLFHPSASAPSSNTIVLKGLNPQQQYTLTFQDRTAQNTTMSGAALMTTGLTVTGLTAQNDSEIIWIN